VAGRNWRRVGLEARELLNHFRSGRATLQSPGAEPLTSLRVSPELWHRE
jgi:hypothetical protein